MSDEMPQERTNLDRFLPFAIGTYVQAIARLIAKKELDIQDIQSKEDLIALLDRLGNGREDAWEIHVNDVRQKLNSIRLTLDSQDYRSAVVLLHVLIEGQINLVLRVLLRMRGFSNVLITTTLSGCDLRSKLNLLLPLLGVEACPRVCQLAYESQSLRNAVVHFKANPSLAYSDEESKGDYEVSQAKSADFFSRNSIESMHDVLESFAEACISKCPVMNQVIEVINGVLCQDE